MAGGFRLDDPAGEVGIELMIVTDTAAPGVDTYLVPLTYRRRRWFGQANLGAAGPRRAGRHTAIPRRGRVLLLGALPLAVTTWWSVATPLLAVLCLVLGQPRRGRGTDADTLSA